MVVRCPGQSSHRNSGTPQWLLLIFIPATVSAMISLLSIVPLKLYKGQQRTHNKKFPLSLKESIILSSFYSSSVSHSCVMPPLLYRNRRKTEKLIEIQNSRARKINANNSHPRLKFTQYIQFQLATMHIWQYFMKLLINDEQRLK